MSNPAAKALFDRAFEHHAAGRFAEAENCYRELLAMIPNDPTATHFLGLAMHHQGRSNDGLPLLEQSVQQEPDAVNFLVNLGAVYRATGAAEKAINTYTRALALDASLAATHFNLANVLRDVNRWEEAEVSYRQAMALKPDYIEALVALAGTISDLGRHDEALNLLDASPMQTAAMLHRQRAIVLGRLYRHDDSEQAARQALELDPNDVESWNSLGIVLQLKGKPAEAKAAYGEAVTRRNTYAHAWTNLGLLLADLREFSDAAKALHNGVQLNPYNAKAYEGLANVFHQTSRLSDAISAGKRAVALNKRSAAACMSVAGAYLDRAQLRDAAGWYERAWAADSRMDVFADGVLLCLHYDSRLSPLKVAEAHFEWGRRMEALIQPNPPLLDPAAGVSRKIRVGYVSPDFREHSVSYFAYPLIANHDRTKFEIHAFSNMTGGDAMTEKFKAVVDAWHDIKPLNDDQLNALIRQLGIDILVDLAGHTAGNRLLAMVQKPAPLLFTYLGYPDTIGSRSFDYRITDRWADPVGMTDAFHSEQLVRLDRTAWCYQPSPVAPPIAPKTTSKQIVFASFNNYSKTSDDTVRLWSKVVRSVPGSVLKLKSKSFTDTETATMVRTRFQMAGLPPERLVLLPPSPSTETHLATYNEVDIALDPFPYNGTTTTCETLWMSVPLITLAGPAHVARVGVSLMNAIGLGSLVAADEKQFVDIAVKLAADKPRLKFFREELRQIMQQSPLMDGVSLARQIEASYVRACRAQSK